MVHAVPCVSVVSLDRWGHNFAFPVILSESNGELCARMPLNRWPTPAMLSLLFNGKNAQTFPTAKIIIY